MCDCPGCPGVAVRRILSATADGVYRLPYEEGLQRELVVSTKSKVGSEREEVEVRWLLKGVSTIIEFRVVVQELSSDRPYTAFPVKEVVMHSPAPGFMHDRACKVLGGFYCKCVVSQEAGKEIWRHWLKNAGKIEAVWPELLLLYHTAFEPGYDFRVAGYGNQAPPMREPVPGLDRGIWYRLRGILRRRRLWK